MKHMNTYDETKDEMKVPPIFPHPEDPTVTHTRCGPFYGDSQTNGCVLR